MVAMLTGLRAGIEGILDTASEDSTEYRIAEFLLKNCYRRKQITIQEAAENCYVSKATVSRFCRQIGYDDFSELNEALLQAYERSDHYKFEEYWKKGSVKDGYFTDLIACIEEARRNIADEQVRHLAELIGRYPRIGILGKLQSNSAATDFQHDLMASHKAATAPVLPSLQREFIENSSDDTLLIIVSCSGTYLRGFMHRDVLKKKNRPYVYLLTNNDPPDPDVYDEIMVIHCKENYASHPLVLKLFLNLTAAEYNRIAVSKKRGKE